jgi:hypothetical protein
MLALGAYDAIACTIWLIAPDALAGGSAMPATDQSVPTVPMPTALVMALLVMS